jgi:hypothetical protein
LAAVFQRLQFFVIRKIVVPIPAREAACAAGGTEQKFLNESEMQRRERDNLLIILEKPIVKSRTPTTRLNY